MAQNQNTRASGGVGIGGLVFCIFLTLKLTGTGAVADWSWWWVTSPLWGGAALLLAVVAAGFGVAAIGDISARRRAKRGW